MSKTLESYMPAVAHIVADLDEIEAEEAVRQAWPEPVLHAPHPIARWWWSPPVDTASRLAASSAARSA